MLEFNDRNDTLGLMNFTDSTGETTFLTGTDCLIGGCANFSNSNSLNTTNTSIYDPAQYNWSISFWIKPINITGDDDYILWGGGIEATRTRWAFSKRVAGNLTTHAMWNTSLNNENESYKVFELDTWLMITMTINDTSVSLYFNDTLYNNEEVRNISGFGGEGMFVIGAVGGGTNYLDGVIDNMGFWNRSLNSSDITQLYNFHQGIPYKFYGENTQTYNETTYELKIEEFELNLSYDNNSYFTPSAKLYYNETAYTGILSSSSGSEAVFLRTLSVPNVDDTENMSFYWEITYPRRTSGSLLENSTMYNQTVFNLGFDDCSTYTNVVYNFTLVDERDQNIIDVATNTSTINVDFLLTSITDPTLTLDYNATFLNNYNPSICISNSTEGFRTDLVVEFLSFDRVTEYYLIDNGTLSTVTQNITLYDLLDYYSTSFLFEFKDANNLPVENGLVEVWRYYVGDGNFKLVETGRMDEDGVTNLHLEEEDAIYFFNITDEGQRIYTSAEYNARCISTPCQIVLSADTKITDFPTDWDLIPEGSWKITSNRTTRVVTLKFNFISPVNMNLTIFRYSENQSIMDYGINSSETTASVGSIEVTVPTLEGNASFYAVVYRDGNWVGSEWINFVKRGMDYFGQIGAFFAGIIILALALIGIGSGAGVIVFIIVGLVVSVALFLLDITYPIIMYIVCAGILLIIKLSKRGV